MSTVAHKAELAKHLNRMRQFFPEDYDFFPRTWLLPDEEEQFTTLVQSRREKGKTPTYIVKPDQGAQGEGIFLIQNPRDLTNLKLPSVVQEYIPNPLLLQGLKFALCPGVWLGPSRGLSQQYRNGKTLYNAVSATQRQKPPPDFHAPH